MKKWCTDKADSTEEKQDKMNVHSIEDCLALVILPETSLLIPHLCRSRRHDTTYCGKLVGHQHRWEPSQQFIPSTERTGTCQTYQRAFADLSYQRSSICTKSHVRPYLHRRTHFYAYGSLSLTAW